MYAAAIPGVVFAWRKIGLAKFLYAERVTTGRATFTLILTSNDGQVHGFLENLVIHSIFYQTRGQFQQALIVYPIISPSS
jgi:hypothetical protein